MLSMHPIGQVRSAYKATKEIPKGLGAKHTMEGVLEVLPEFEAGLQDIEGFSHLTILWVFHRSTDFELVGNTPTDNRVHGVFSTRSPRRPNPIGLTVVELLGQRAADPRRRREVQPVPRPHIKGVVPGIGVSSRTNHSKLSRGMRIAYYLFFDVVVGDFSAPSLGPSEKHTLIAGVTIEDRRRLSLERSAISVEREREATQIRDVFAHGQFAVYMDSGNRFVF